jgi:hypothetical protein
MKFRWKERVFPVEEQFLTAQVSFDTCQVRSEAWVVCLIFWMTQKLGNTWSTALTTVELTVFDWMSAEQWDILRVGPIFVIPNKLASVILSWASMFRCRCCIWHPPASPRSSKFTRSQDNYPCPVSPDWNKVGDYLKRLLRNVLCPRSIRGERAFEHDVVSCGHQLH